MLTCRIPWLDLYRFYNATFADLFSRFSDAGKRYGAVNANSAKVLQFAAGNNIESASAPRQQFQDAEVAVSFHREAKQ